jgi:hypothetical protein
MIDTESGLVATGDRLHIGSARIIGDIKVIGTTDIVPNAMRTPMGTMVGGNR